MQATAKMIYVTIKYRVFHVSWTNMVH